MASIIDRPWEELARLIGTKDRQAVESYLGAIPASEVARAVSRLEPEVQSQLLATLGPQTAADLVHAIPDVQAAGMIGRIAPGKAAAILDTLQSAGRADILGELDDTSAEAILSEMVPHFAQGARTLREYPTDVAGGLMLAEYLAYPRDHTVGDVVDDLRQHADEYRDYQVQYAYVIGEGGVLIGVLRLRDLLLAAKRRPIEELMISAPVTVPDNAPLEDLIDLFDSHRFRFLAVPVVDEHHSLVGVIVRNRVEAAAGERGISDYRKSQGIIGGEELRTMPLLLRARRRLSWLSINILLNICAASVIALHQDTLSAVIALAVFLPIISDMSGCSGNQAVAVSMRELALGLVTPRELARVLWKEAAIGILNGTALGLLIAAVAWIWKGNGYLGLVVGSAMAVNTVIAVSVGGTVPLVLRRLRLDPALASGPILTTVTDFSGFLLILTLASALLPQLTAK